MSAEHLRNVICTFASTETVGSGRDFHHPLVDLLVCTLGTPSSSVNQTTDRISVARCTVRIQLTTLVTLLDVELGQVSRTCDLQVGGGTDKVYRVESPIGNLACTVILGAPGYLDLLSHRHFLTCGRRSPKTEVLCRVEKERLAHGRVRVRTRATVCTRLTRLASVGQVRVAELVNRSVILLHLVQPPIVGDDRHGCVRTELLGVLDAVDRLPVDALGVLDRLRCTSGQRVHAIRSMSAGCLGSTVGTG